MFSIPFQSRSANALLMVLGALYSVCAPVLLFWILITSHEAASFTDRIVQITLFGAAVSGVWLALNALQSLGVRRYPSSLRSKRR